MYEVIGHTQVRDQVSRLRGSYALCGPDGVGRRGVALEWAAGRPHEILDLTKDARRIIRAIEYPDIVYVAELGGPHTWVPLLRLLEEASITMALIAHQVPQPIRTRIPVLSVGYLTEIEVTQILARDFTRYHPRHVIARMAQGTMCDIHLLAAAAQTFETLERVIQHRRADYREHSPLALFYAIRSLCLSIHGLVVLPFTESLRQQVPPSIAAAFLRYPEPDPKNEHQARNLVQLFLGALHG